MCQIGRIVYSKCGRDKRRPFIVYHTDGEYLFLIDGELRKLDKPKKKKLKHVQVTNDVNSDIGDKLINNLYINDSEIRKALAPYRLNDKGVLKLVEE